MGVVRVGEQKSRTSDSKEGTYRKKRREASGRKHMDTTTHNHLSDRLDRV